MLRTPGCPIKVTRRSISKRLVLSTIVAFSIGNGTCSRRLRTFCRAYPETGFGITHS